MRVNRNSGSSTRAEAIAHDFQGKMNQFISGANDWKFHGQDTGSDRGRSTLMIIDRAEDPLSPLMHEFTYQVSEWPVMRLNHVCLTHVC